MSRRWRGWSAGVPLLATLACGSEPIPTVAVAGTTISIAIPPTYPVGFGTTLTIGMSRVFLTTSLNLSVAYPCGDTGGGCITSAGGWHPISAREDEVRGELVWSLWNSSNAFVTYLPIRQISRVRADESSPALTDLDDPDGPRLSGTQVIAMVDIPRNVVAGMYSIHVERYRRETASPYAFVREQPQLEGGEWVGWGQLSPEPASGIPIEIKGSSETLVNDFLGWDDFFGSLVYADLRPDAPLTVPHPAVRIELYDSAASEPAPGAVDFVVRYPREKVEILGVQIERPHRSSAVALVTEDTATPTGCGSDPGSVAVSILDPEAETSVIQLAYRLRSFTTCGRLDAASELTIEDVRSYDPTGQATPATSVAVLPGDF